MRVKKRVKRGVKKGIKRVKSAPPESYVAGAGLLVAGAAVVLLATTKSGRELLIRTAQQALRPEANEQESQDTDVPEADEQESQDTDVPEADEQESQDTDVPEADEQESQEADVQEDVDNEPAEDADFAEGPEEDTNGDEESRVTDLKPRDQRPRSAAPGRRPRSPRKASAPAES
jgi:hypothetical protein